MRRIIRAARFSLQGIQHAWRYEAAFRQEVAIAAILTPVGLWLGTTPLERALLVGSLVGILIVELLNSAIESAIDRHGDEHHELSGRAKDLGSAAVMLSLVLAGLLWSASAYQRFFSG